jgi:hypothetical protein
MLSIITTQFGVTGHAPDFRVITALPIRFYQRLSNQDFGKSRMHETACDQHGTM